MSTYIVNYECWDRTSANNGESLMIRKIMQEEVEAVTYIPLPQKVVNFYKTKRGNQAPEEIIATFYEVISVKVK